MSLKLKNDWEYVGDDRWDWEVYLVSDKPQELDDVSSVEYILHPTFPNPIRTVTKREGGFRLKTNGWGTFQVAAFVNFKDGKRRRLEHELVLEYKPTAGSSP